MDGEDPDLEAFEYDLRRILRARELGKTAALVSNLISNLSDPHSVGLWWRSSIYQLFLFLSIARNVLQFGGRTRQGIVETADAAALELETIQGGIPLYEMYVLDTKEKPDPREHQQISPEPWETQRLSI